MPGPQTAKQREFEARVKALGTQIARRLGVSRRRFFQSAAGMAAAFLAMNDTYGPVFGVAKAEATEPERADDRAKKLSGQFIMDMHTHFLRPGTKMMTFVAQRQAVGKAGWNPELRGKEQTIDDLMFANYLKEIYLDSDTKVACISGAPSEVPEDWFLTNEMKAQARADVNGLAGSKRMFAHAIFTPGYDGWMEQVDHAISDLKPDSMKGYTIGDNTNKNLSKHPWRMDDEKLVYPAYAKFLKAGLKNVCVHKGLFPPSVEKQFPKLLAYSDVRDVGKAAKDWPQLNFIIYHGGYRFAGGGSVGRCLGAARAHRTRRMGHRPGRNSRQVWRDQCLRRCRPAVRAIDARRSAGRPRSCSASSSRAWGPTTCAGAPTPSGRARRNGRSRRCGASRFPTTCRRSTACSRWALPTGRSRRRFSAATTRACTTSARSSTPRSDSDGLARYRALYDKHGAGRTNLAYGYALKPRA